MVSQGSEISVREPTPADASALWEAGYVFVGACGEQEKVVRRRSKRNQRLGPGSARAGYRPAWPGRSRGRVKGSALAGSLPSFIVVVEPPVFVSVSLFEGEHATPVVVPSPLPSLLIPSPPRENGPLRHPRSTHSQAETSLESTGN